ncbi:MAG: hypothetical protein SangKO_041370 [Sandaracinaceae bacterium]
MTTAGLPRSVRDLGAGFTNIRGSFKLLGVDLGTQCSLVRRPSGRYVLLDACGLDEETAGWLDRTTEGGALLDAVLHLHPFHTLSVREMHERYPDAKLYGTLRHHDRARDLPWEPLTTDDPELHESFGDALRFSVPRGVVLISDDEKVHFSSVLAIHPASKTLHVDDTLVYVRLPKALRWLKEDSLRFHPTLSRALENRPGAAADFRAWARELAQELEGVENICAAHSAVLRGDRGDAPKARVERALEKAERALSAHEREHR